MKICPDDQMVMRRVQNWGDDDSPVAVTFECECGRREPGCPEDTRIAGQVRGRGNVMKQYAAYIAISVHDRTIELVPFACPDCKLDYLAQLRLGEDEIVIWRCDCGYDSSKPGTKRPAELDKPLGE